MYEAKSLGEVVSSFPTLKLLIKTIILRKIISKLEQSLFSHQLSALNFIKTP